MSILGRTLQKCSHVQHLAYSSQYCNTMRAASSFHSSGAFSLGTVRMSLNPAGSCLEINAVGKYFFAVSRADIAAVGAASASGSVASAMFMFASAPAPPVPAVPTVPAAGTVGTPQTRLRTSASRPCPTPTYSYLYYHGTPRMTNPTVIGPELTLSLAIMASAHSGCVLPSILIKRRSRCARTMYTVSACGHI